MIYDFVTTESRLRRDLAQDLAWQELGWSWPHLGLYKPEGDRWRRQPSSEGGLGDYLHRHGKVIFTNGGWTAGLARYCDGHMSEGTGPTRRLQYICMLKHLTLLCYDSSLKTGKEKVKLALALPDGLRGNIFRNAQGNYLATAVRDDDRPPPFPAQIRPMTLQIRLPDAQEVRQVFAWSPDFKGYRAADVKRDDRGLAVTSPCPESCVALLLARQGRWIACETARLIAGRRQSVRIVLANLTATDWEGRWETKAGPAAKSCRLRIPAGGSTKRCSGT